MRHPLLLAVMLILAAPQAALAGSVSIGKVVTDSKYGYETSVLVFTAAPGERNQIVVARVDGVPGFVLHDAGAAVSGADCPRIDANTVICDAERVAVDAGDGDDTVRMPTVATTSGPRVFVLDSYARGGDGADAMTGDAFLAGGPGNDLLTCPRRCVLAGGGGDDVLRGGSSDDLLSGDGDGPAGLIGYEAPITDAPQRGTDTIDGGPGRDQLTYRGRITDVKVDLAARTATGGGGELDRLAGIEDVSGGSGADFLLGDAGDNQLEGGPGDDRIAGRGGADYLLGNLVPETNEYSVGYTPPDPGADRLSGGRGDDILDAGSERGDALSGGSGNDVLQDGVGGASRARTVRCGSGRDLIQFALRGQRVSGCETLAIGVGHARIGLRPQRRSGRRLRFAFRCGARYQACTMAIGVRVGARPRVRRSVKLGGKRVRSLYVRLPRSARRGAVVDVQLILAGASPSGGPAGARWRVRL